MTNRKSSASAVSPDAVAVFSALGRVVSWLRRHPLPPELVAKTLSGPKPRPRHIAAMLQLAGEDSLSVSELAERLRISLATASQLVSDLAEIGFVRRIEDPADRRRTLVQISSEHRALHQQVLQLRLRPINEALHRLSVEERDGLRHGLERLAEELTGQPECLPTAGGAR